MIYCSYNGIIHTKNSILSLGYGPGNYNPRYYEKISLK